MQKPLIVVHHVPKTAGSALRLAIKDNIGPKRIYWHIADGNIREDLPRLRREQDSIDIIGGHFDFRVADQIKFDRPILRFSMARDPVDLVFSAINHVLQLPDHPQFTRVPPDDPDFLETGLFQRYSKTQCQLMAAETEADKAIARIESVPYVIGHMNNVTTVMDRIMAEIGEPIRSPLIPDNVGSGDFTWFDEDKAREQFQAGVAEDRKLFDYVMNECGGLLDTTRKTRAA